MACCGDVPTLETLAAVDLLRRHAPELKVRVVNVVDLMKLQPASEHPHGLSDQDFDALFTTDKPIIFAFHGYPWLIHRLTYRRTGHENLHVRGYKEEGTTSTPFDMCVMNDLDRFHLVERRDRPRAEARMRGPPTPSKRSATSSSTTRSIFAGMATTCRRSLAGHGGKPPERQPGPRHPRITCERARSASTCLYPVPSEAILQVGVRRDPPLRARPRRATTALSASEMTGSVAVRFCHISRRLQRSGRCEYS